MPYISKGRRAQGGYVDRHVPALDMPPAGPCDHYTAADGVCGAPGVGRYMVGPRCAVHTPAALNGRPEPGRTAGHTPSPMFERPPEPRRWPDDTCVPCVHCRQPVAAVNVDLFGVAEHVACVPPPRRRGVTVWAEGDPEPWSRELVETRTADLLTRNRKAA